MSYSEAVYAVSGLPLILLAGLYLCNKIGRRCTFLISLSLALIFCKLRFHSPCNLLSIIIVMILTYSFTKPLNPLRSDVGGRPRLIIYTIVMMIANFHSLKYHFKLIGPFIIFTWIQIKESSSYGRKILRTIVNEL